MSPLLSPTEPWTGPRSWQRVQRAQAHKAQPHCVPSRMPLHFKCTVRLADLPMPQDLPGSEKQEGRSGYSPLRPERARPFDRGGFYPLRMCVGGLHVILWASRRAGVHSRNRGRSLDSYCRRQIRPGSRIEPPVLEFQTKDRVWIRQLEKARTARRRRSESSQWRAIRKLRRPEVVIVGDRRQ